MPMLLALIFLAAAPSLEAGDALFDEGRLEDAEQVFRALLSREPEKADLHYRMGRIQVRRGDRTLARKSFKTATSANHRYWPAFHALAQLELDDERDEAALAASKGCLIAKPAQPDCLETQALALNRLNRAGESLPVWERLVKIRESDVNVRVNLAKIYREVGREDDARAAVTAALLLDPDHAMANYLQASILVEKGENTQAIAHLRRALSSRPEFVQAETLLRQLSAMEPKP